MIYHIKLCSNKYSEYFPNRSLEDLNDTKDQKVFFEKIASFYEESFILISKSILSAEYYYNADIKKDLDAFIETLQKEDINVIESNDTLLSLTKQFISLNLNLTNSLNTYKTFLNIVENSYSYDNSIELLFNQVIIRTPTQPNTLHRFFVSSIVKACSFDFTLSKRTSSELIELSDTSEDIIRSVKTLNQDIENICKITLDKLHFFISKISSKNFYYSTDGVIKNTNTNNINLPEDLKKYIHIRYFKDNLYPETYTSLIQTIYNKEHINCESCIRLATYLSTSKDIPTNSKLNDLDIIISKFKEKYYSNLEFENSYDRFSIDSVYNYLLNCRFSYITKLNNINLDELESELQKIVSVQNPNSSFGIKNFHPYEKFIEYLILKFENTINKGVYKLSETDMDQLGSILEYLKIYIPRFGDTIKWCSSKTYFPFLIPYSEALKSIYDLNIFIPSTSARPINYKKLESIKDAFNSKLSNLSDRFQLIQDQKQLIQIQDSIEARLIDDKKEFKDEIQSTNDKISFFEKRTYEIVAIFSGAITFLFGTVNIFSQNTSLNFHELMTNTIGLGFIILLFSSLILLSTSKFVLNIPFKTLKRTTRFKVLIAFIIAYIIIIFISIYVIERHTSKSIQENNIAFLV